MKKTFSLWRYLCAVLLTVTFGVSQMWATDWIRLDSIDFTNTTNFPQQTITGPNSGTTTKTISGVYFIAKAKKSIKINNTAAGIDFDGQNGDASSHNFGIPVTGVNGSLKVIVYHDYNTTSASFKVGISHAEGNAPSASQTWDLSPTNSGTKNKDDFQITKTELTGTDYIVWAMEAGSSYKVIKRIAIYTEAPSCDPIGVASTGTASDVTYNSASLPFTMDKTTGVASLTINVYDNSDDSEPVATYSGITPATTGSQAATGLSETTTYYYTITTVSAGGDYCEGVTTAKSATFTTNAAPVANPIITGAVNEDGWGTVAPASITVTSGDVLSIDGATITCGDYSLTATPAAADAEYTYAFESWSGVSAGAVTTNLTATANFTRTPNTYDVNYTAATNGSYTIKVGEAEAVSANTTAAFGQTVTLAATPSSGYKLGSWSVYKTGEESTKVTVTNNAFTMPAYAVTVAATFVEAAVLYDYAVMAAAGNKSFTNEDVTADQGASKDITFGTSGNPQLVIVDAGWDNKENILNSFIKFFGGTTNMSVVIPTNKLATVTIKYGSYDASGKYLTVGGEAQEKPKKKLDNSITTSNIDDYVATVELTNQLGTLVLGASTGNIYIAYVDVAITGTVTPTAIENAKDEQKAVKTLKNGLLIIEKNGVRYNMLGERVQ